MHDTDEMTEAQREYLECIGVVVDTVERREPSDAWRTAHEPTDDELRWEKILRAAE